MIHERNSKNNLSSRGFAKQSSKVILFVALCLFPLIVSAKFNITSCTNLTGFEKPKICLQTPLGATTYVSGLPEYIKVFFNLFVGASMILAAFMVVIGGVRWLFARGNPGKVSEAKKSIGGAITGMLLVFISVALLRIINPDLVEYKIAQLQSLKGFNLADMCRDIPDVTNPDGSVRSIQNVLVNGAPVPKNSSELKCGTSYQIEGSSRSLCWGHDGCPSPQQCVFDQETKKSKCITGTRIAGTIKWVPDPSNTENDPYVKAVGIYSVCGRLNSSDFVVNKLLLSVNVLDRDKHYDGQFDLAKFEASADKEKEYCSRDYSSGDYIDGFVIGIMVNEGNSYFVDTDDWFALKKGNCTKPVKNPSGTIIDLNTSDRNRSYYTISSADYYTYQDFLSKGSIECNISIDRVDFPEQ